MNPTNPVAEKKTIDKLFFLSMFVKATGAVFEIGTGIASLFLTTNEVLHATQLLVQGKLDADPDDFLANYILNLAARWTPGATNLFLFWYLVGHGVINLLLVIALVRKKTWAYPLSFAVFGAFIVYEVWQFSVTFSALIGVFIIFDLAVLWLIWREYRYMRHKHSR